MELVSVIIPVYNAEQFINECVDSILKQTYKNVELIMVDDCSSDSSIVLCENIINKNKNVILLRQPVNMGPMAARIAGIQKAEGRYIVFCDADDHFPLDSIENLLIGHNEMQTDMVIGNFAQQYGNRIIDNKNRLKNGIYRTNELLPIQIDDGTLSGILISSQCAKLYDKNILINFIDELPLSVRINEDGIFNTYYLLTSKTVGVMGKRVYIQRNWKRVNKNSIVDIQLFKPANQELLKLKDKWHDYGNFNQQMELRRLTVAFWLSNNICHRMGFFLAVRQMKIIIDELDINKLLQLINEKSMRKYKIFFWKLIKNKRFGLLYIFFKWFAPAVRKFIPR